MASGVTCQFMLYATTYMCPPPFFVEYRAIPLHTSDTCITLQAFGVHGYT